MYRLLRFFIKVRARSFCCSFFPNRSRLRWVAIWFRVQTQKSRHLYCFDVPTRCKWHIACNELFHFIAKLITCSFCCSSLPNRTRCRWASIWFWVQNWGLASILLQCSKKQLPEWAAVFLFGFRSRRWLCPSEFQCSGRWSLLPFYVSIFVCVQ